MTPARAAIALSLGLAVSPKAGLAVETYNDCSDATDFPDRSGSWYGSAGTSGGGQDDCETDSTFTILIADPTKIDSDLSKGAYDESTYQCRQTTQSYEITLPSSTDYWIWYRDLDGDTYYDADETHYCAVAIDTVYDDTSSIDHKDYWPAQAYGLVYGWVWSEATAGADCDDTSASRNLFETFYADPDGDGYALSSAATTEDCEDSPPSGYIAARGDGLEDCDESLSTRNEGAAEVCDAADVDEDCDGDADDDDASATGQTTWYRDDDDDGYGDEAYAGTSRCDTTRYTVVVPGTGVTYHDYVSNNDDCDDDDGSINPGATEACDDIDNNCDGTIDEAPSGATGWYSTWYHDEDGDGYGDSTDTTSSCDDPDSGAGTDEWVSDSTDCDDTGPDINPAADEVCDGADNDCDSSIDEADATDAITCYPDDDGDGYGDEDDAGTVACSCAADEVTDHTDCDDTRSTINPSKTEVCDDDDLDEDCDDLADDADSSVSNAGKTKYYPDDDQDGYGDDSASATSYCDDPSTAASWYNTDHTDCDDTDADINPGEDEICDGKDNDCDSSTKEDSEAGSVWYFDDDGDGYGDATITATACDDPDIDAGTSEWVANDDDCDDDDKYVYPGATERCNGVYDDCDDRGSSSSAPDDESDLDGDGYVECTYKSSTWQGDAVDGGDDCNDDDDTVYPDADEICDGIYNDCNDVAYDDAVPPEDEDDTDGDGYVACAGYKSRTWVGDSSVVGGDDCDPNDDRVYPGATEICDGQYDDCDDSDYDSSAIPEGETDGDGDGYVSDTCVIDADWEGDSGVVGGDDCDDDNEYVYPGATEICDGVYNDCSSSDYSATDTPDDELDEDEDLYVSCTYIERLWDGDPAILGGDDCDDEDATVYPGADEVCDGQFNDCDDLEYDADSAPDDELDDDGDRYIDCTGYDEDTWEGDPLVLGNEDCNDEDATVYPGAEEVCDGQYNDCDSKYYDEDSAPSDELDDDEDGYVDCDITEADWATKDEPDGGDDCDDDDDTVYPGAPERCDGIYNDCDDLGYIYDLQDAPDDELDDDDDGYVDCNYSSGTWVGDDATVVGGEDCDDDDDTVYPSAQELCDGQYNDCDDLAYNDYDCPADEWDDDGDGFTECVRYSTVAWQPYDNETDAPLNDSLEDCIDNRNCYDCDDEDASTYPGAAELEDETECMTDADGDGYGEEDVGDDVTAGTDCDDDDDEVYPGATEVCESGDQTDNDCNGDYNTWYDPDTDSDQPVSTTTGVDVYLDSDGDGFGDPDASLTICDYGDGFSVLPTDCDDDDATRYPGATELCNGEDDDCDLEADEWDESDSESGLDAEKSGCVDMYRDQDYDDYGDYDNSACLCLLSTTNYVEARGDRYVRWGGDCDDNNDEVHPLSCEDGLDNDDDGKTDGPTTAEEWAGDLSGYDEDCLEGFNEDGDEVETRKEFLDGHDNDCDGYIPAIELDCDDDGSLPLLPLRTTVGEIAEDFGLADCNTSALDTLEIACWDETDLQLDCDATSGLWMLRYDESDDGWGGRYEDGRRVYSATISCDATGDCDDHCATRCPGVEEECDGVDNDCSGASGGDDDDGLPDPLDADVSVTGTISDGEVDLDGDGYLNCDDFNADDEQLQQASRSCGDEITDEEVLEDCNDLCVISSPGAEERCDGLTDVCDGDGEGTDSDADNHNTCGAWSGDDGEATLEDVYVVVWINNSSGTSTAETGDTGASTARRLRRIDTADTADTAGDTFSTEPSTSDTSNSDTSSADTGALSGDAVDYIPLLLPRTGAPDCDDPLTAWLTALVGADTLNAAIEASDPTALLSVCDQGDGWACGLVRLTLDREADEALEDQTAWINADASGLISDACASAPQQYITRTVWSRSRILAARETVVEAECMRLYGARCAALNLPASLDPDREDWVDASAALSSELQWWMEIGRFDPSAITNGTLMSCWGDPTDDFDVDTLSTGGDCSDSEDGANRDQPEGPGDLLALYALEAGDTGASPDCSLCTDGIDNNCDGQIDCADPSCAVCFVGQGGGCGASADGPCTSAACGVIGSKKRQPDGIKLAGLLGLLAAATRRRRRR